MSKPNILGWIIRNLLIRGMGSLPVTVNEGLE